MIELAKMALRMSNNDYDMEIQGLIDACLRDLELAGVFPSEFQRETDPLILHAVLTFVKANFGFSDDSEKYHRQYDAAKLNLRESRDYNAVE